MFLTRKQAVGGRRRHNMPCPSPPSVGAEASRAAEPTAPGDRNVAVVSHAHYGPTVTAAAA